MKKYYRRIIVIFCVCLLCSFFVVTANGDNSLKKYLESPSVVIMNDRSDEKLNVNKADNKEALIIYSKDDYSQKYLYNLEIVLKHMLIDFKKIEVNRTDTVSFSDYDLIIIATNKFEDIGDSISSLFKYVSKGGCLFIGIVPESTESGFASIYRKLGISEYGDYIEYNNLTFTDELIAGAMGEEFSGEEFSVVGLSVSLSDKCHVYVESKLSNSTLPIVWSYDYENGRIVFYNGTALAGDFWRGFLAGCINALFKSNIYPIINASCIYIDDFPSPQYENTSDITKEQYNKSVKEFYRDIWWPDMQKIANKYQDKYVGLFMATYNDIVEPEDFEYNEVSMEQYYGNSLLKEGHEMGANGYNHQSLTLEGGTPDYLEYKAWDNEKDMEASLIKLVEITKNLFPSVRFKTYVPPSNYLSEEGKQAVKNVLPDLKTISGTLSSEGVTGEVCRQDFEIDNDGIAYFPRITSGMVMDDFTRFQIVNGMGLYGVFSHFIHPDDLFDEERSFGLSWEELYSEYCNMMEWYHSTYKYARSMTSSDAADALKVAMDAAPYVIYEEGCIYGSVDNFYGEAFFYLKTDRKPVVSDDSCTIENIDGGEYYLLTVKSANFKVDLK